MSSLRAICLCFMLRQTRYRLRLEWWHHLHQKSRLLSSFSSSILHTSIAFSRPFRLQDGHWCSGHHMNIHKSLLQTNGNVKRERFQAGVPSAYISLVTPIYQGGWESSLLSGKMSPQYNSDSPRNLNHIGYQQNKSVEDIEHFCLCHTT